MAQYGEICQGHTVIFLGQLEIQFPPLTIDSMEQAQRNGAFKCSTLIDCPNEARKKKKKKGHWMSQIKNYQNILVYWSLLL